MSSAASGSTERSGDTFAPIRERIVELLLSLDTAARGSTQVFYDRICEAVCEAAGMTRCALLLYDEREKRVLPAGSHGIAPEIVEVLHGTLDETPLAARSLAEDRVLVTSELEEAIPERHRTLPGVEALACVPVTAGNRWLGVMLCDRGGGVFDLDQAQRDMMWALGKTAALAASTRIGIEQHERAKLLAERVAFAREVHDRVMQRLFGISLALGSDQTLDAEEQQRAGEEIQTALADLRAALQADAEPAPAPPSATLAAEVERLRSHYPELRFEIALDGGEPPSRFQALAQSVLAEALHNARKHAEPGLVEVVSRRNDDAFMLEVRNDGAAAPKPGAGGMGLRLAAFEVLQRGGVLEFGHLEPDGWRVRMLAPLEPA
jgi:signal transduction histidine kinase